MDKLIDVYVAKCCLSCVDEFEYEINFYFKKEEEKYKIDKENRRFIRKNGYYSIERIPMDIKVYNFYGDVVAKQGFDHELSKQELEIVKQNMIKALEDKLKDDEEFIKKTYEAKFKALENEV